MSSRRRPSKEARPTERESIGFRRRREKQQAVEQLLAGRPLVVGIDLAKRTHAVWLTGRDLVPLARFTIRHSRDGVATLLAKARRLCDQHDLERPLVFMEATSHFWRNVANELEENGVVYRLIPPLAVDRKREIEHLTFAKGDFRDAELIARLGVEGNWLRRTLESDPVWIELAALAREHELLVELENRERHRVRNLLEFAVPEFLECFMDPLKLTARAALRLLTAPPARTFAELAERAAQFKGGGKGARRLYKGKARTLAAALEATPSYGVERWLAAALARVGFSVGRFDALGAQRELVRAALGEAYENTGYQRWLDTIPGVDPVTHALILGLIGDPRGYDRGSCLVKLAGLEPRENHSGEVEGSHSISRRGKPLLRLVLFRIVFGFLKANPEFATYIKRLVDRTKNPLTYHQAFVAASNKYLRLVHTLCTNKLAYDPSKTVAAP
jgi:transposase